MTLIVQIVLGLLLVVGLVTIIMSNKNWHWTKLTLVLLIFFAGVGYLFLAAETVRIHQNLRKNIPRFQDQIATLEKQNYELVNGVRDEPGINELDHRLQIVTRERGRVWRNVMPAGQLNPEGALPVEITSPIPHGLEQDAIVYAFESGNPNSADPSGGPQYLGEFRVKAVQEGGALLESVLLLGNRDRQRLGSSQGPWRLYETMPIDRHALYAELGEEALRQMVPAESADEYLRHGTEATADDDQWHVIGIDDNGNRVGPDNIDQAVRKLYDRSLRDYAFIFNQLAGERIVAIAKQAAVAKDNEKLLQSLEGAEATGKFRQQQIDSLNRDLAGMKTDREAIESHRDAVLGLLTHFEERIAGYLKANSELAKRYTTQQLGLASYIDRVAPAP
ncbi:MAG: hypothetical protein AAGD11_16505 [Planctomycetota bacterium]